MAGPADRPPAGPRTAPGLQYGLSATVLFLALFGSHLATPLYPIWKGELGLSNTDIVIIFAGYPVGVTLGLLHGGRLGDQLGRKPLTRVGLLVIIVASLCYTGAGSMTLLLVARLANGYGIGLLSGPAVAAIVELHPRHDRGAASRLGAIATLCAPAAGLFTASIIAYAVSPERATALPYHIFTALLLTGLLATLFYAETILPQAKRSLSDTSWQPQCLRVPPEIAGTFIYTACVATMAWANTGLWLSLGPSIIVGLMEDAHPLSGGLSVVVFLSMAGLVQLVGRRLGYVLAIEIALWLVAVSLCTVLLSLHLGRVAGVALGMVLGGMSQGLAWMGAVELVNRIAPDLVRASVLSVLYIYCYFGSIVPVFLTGYLADRAGLGTAFLGISLLSMCLAAILLVVTARIRASLPPPGRDLPLVPDPVDKPRPASRAE